MKNNLNEQDFNNLYLVSFSLSSIQRILPLSFVFYFLSRLTMIFLHLHISIENIRTKFFFSILLKVYCRT